MMKFIRQCLYSISLMVLLVGCDTFSSRDSECLKPVLVQNMSRLPLYPIFHDDPRFATLSVVKSTCQTSSDEISIGQPSVEIDLALTIVEARKPTRKTKEVIFPIFIALLDKQDNVLDRHDERIGVTITDKSLNQSHKIKYLFPQGIDIGKADYRLFLGFLGNVMATHSGTHKHHTKVSVPK